MRNPILEETGVHRGGGLNQQPTILFILFITVTNITKLPHEGQGGLFQRVPLAPRACRAPQLWERVTGGVSLHCGQEVSRDKTPTGQVPGEPFLQALERKKESTGGRVRERKVCHSAGGVSTRQECEAGGSARGLWLDSRKNKEYDSG